MFGISLFIVIILLFNNSYSTVKHVCFTFKVELSMWLTLVLGLLKTFRNFQTLSDKMNLMSCNIANAYYSLTSKFLVLKVYFFLFLDDGLYLNGFVRFCC